MNVMTTATPAVELLSFAKSYRLGWIQGLCPAVQALTLRLAPGQVLGLLGPNGSGKSTTLKALAGLLMPTSGQCRIFGQPAGGDAARALIGYLPEATRFSPHLSGREFLHFCAGLSSMDGEAARQRVDEVLAWSGLKGQASKGSPPIPRAWHSGSGWRRRSCTILRSCYWTSRPAAWIPKAVWRSMS